VPLCMAIMKSGIENDMTVFKLNFFIVILITEIIVSRNTDYENNEVFVNLPEKSPIFCAVNILNSKFARQTA
jgi:hypothetical protein